MKKIAPLFIVIVMSLFILQSCAKKMTQAMTQSEPQPGKLLSQEPLHPLPLQAIVGAQVSSLPGEDESYRPLAGFQAGCIMPIARFNQFTQLRAELNGSMQGANYEEDYGLNGKVSLFYINVPLVVRYQFKSGFFGEAGIQPGFCISAKDKYSGTTYNYKDHINTFDFGLPFGIGYEFNNNFSIGIRVIEGLSNINSTGDKKDHNFVMALRGTYSFNGKKK